MNINLMAGISFGILKIGYINPGFFQQRKMPQKRIVPKAFPVVLIRK